MSKKEKDGIFSDLESYLLMLKEAFRGRYKLPWGALLWPLAFVAYLIIPIDIVPEALLGPFGLTDDAAFMAFLLYRLRRYARDFRTSQIDSPENNTPKRTDGGRS